MKRLGLFFAFVFFMMNFLTIPAIAADSGTDYPIYYEDGSYAIITLDSTSIRSTKDEMKVYTYYNPLGQRCFAYTLTASFTYNGVTSQADSVGYKGTIYRQGWNLSTHSEYVSGNTAYGSAKFTGPDGQTRPATLTLTCDKNGTVT